MPLLNEQFKHCTICIVNEKFVYFDAYVTPYLWHSMAWRVTVTGRNPVRCNLSNGLDHGTPGYFLRKKLDLPVRVI